MRLAELPEIAAWNSRVGLVEEYEYPRGRAGASPLHAHRDVQICFSLDFPGRYFYRGKVHDVPIGAISVLDSWEPHAVSDPCDRDRLSHYIVMYVDPVGFRSAVDLPPGSPIDEPIRRDSPAVYRFRAFYHALTSEESILEQDERYRELVATLMSGGSDRAKPAPSTGSLLRARDYIAANAVERISLQEIAGVADLSPWHLVRAFRRRFGMPPHRFQLWMRIDLARRLLADGEEHAEVAQLTGFADQSHFIRCFKRFVQTTPGRYRKQVRQYRKLFFLPID